jgi:uncharacterized protein
MLVYTASKAEFIEDVRSNRIEEIINNEVRRKLNRNSPKNEILSWKYSLDFMLKILIDPEIPSSAGVAIEYSIPLTNRRVDFILTGKNEELKDTAVIIELKQWSEARKTEKDGIVRTVINGADREVNHPSYQAWSYAALIEDYNETVRKESIKLQPCAYLHNMKSHNAINDPFYSFHTDKAPVFISEDAFRLSEFLKRFVKYGDTDDIMYRIEHGVIKPSKTLADSLTSMLDGNREFILLDEQKIVYETALDLAYKSQEQGKQTLIVKGGPGTGKSVVAINLLVEFTKREMLAQYVTKNSAPREVFKSMLTGTRRKTQIDNLFKGSGSYVDVKSNYFNVLIVDEAHRLNEKGGLYGNLGENQIKELIHSSRLSVFFIDEAQRVTFQDIGSVAAIRQWASELGSTTCELELESQFRCNGSDGYLAWIDNTLGVRPTANETLEDIDYDFRVFDDPNSLREAIIEKNRLSNKARMVAGYCWDWNSKKDSNAYDIILPEYKFKARWNLTRDGSLWLISEDSVSEIGCIHTCQGLELDYVGVIIGGDFVIRDGSPVTDAAKRSSRDKSIRGYKKLLKQDSAKAKVLADEIIKNTYRTLMTRGLKGCYIFCADKETNEYFKSLIHKPSTDVSVRDTANAKYPGLTLPVLDKRDIRPYVDCVPVYDLKIAAGKFGDTQSIDEAGHDWVLLPDAFRIQPGLFVAQVVGESMNRHIPNGAWCLFRLNPTGTRQGKVVVAQHKNIQDADTGAEYTVKVYESLKITSEDGTWRHEKVLLKPDTNHPGYKPIEVTGNELGELKIIAELVAII